LGFDRLMRENALVRRLLLLALALVLAGCGGGSETTTTAPEVGLTVGGFRVLKIIVVHESEYRITPSKVTVDRLGYYGIKAVNDGATTHALELEGPGIKKGTGSIAPGASKAFAVFFKQSGTYRLSCPIDEHASKGMKGTITVP
jgi:plastocyanin